MKTANHGRTGYFRRRKRRGVSPSLLVMVFAMHTEMLLDPMPVKRKGESEPSAHPPHVDL